MIICPRCNRKVFYAANSGPDVVHRCDSKKESIDKESVVKMGNWSEYGTTGTVANANLQGFGSRAGGMSDTNIDKLDAEGKRVATHRRRQHFETINIGGN